jgi:hypothetical protein
MVGTESSSNEQTDLANFEEKLK